METSRKLEALIQKAIDGDLLWNGYKILSFKVGIKDGHLPIYLETDETYTWVDDEEIEHIENNGQAVSIESFIYNHSVARSLFGEEKREQKGYFWASSYDMDGESYNTIEELLDSGWLDDDEQQQVKEEFLSDDECSLGHCIVGKKYVITNKGFEFHLQQAVISKDPIGYIYKVVFDES